MGKRAEVVGESRVLLMQHVSPLTRLRRLNWSILKTFLFVEIKIFVATFHDRKLNRKTREDVQWRGDDRLLDMRVFLSRYYRPLGLTNKDRKIIRDLMAHHPREWDWDVSPQLSQSNIPPTIYLKLPSFCHHWAETFTLLLTAQER